MAFTPKDWKDAPDATTPINAAALEDLEDRVTDYTDTEVATRAASSHTHTASEVTDFNTAVRTNRLDQMTAPNTSLSMGTQKITNVVDPTAGSQEAATAKYAEDAATAIAAIVAGTKIPNSLPAAKGDLIAASANDTPAILSAGANDELPIYDSGQTVGLKKAKIVNANVDAAAAIAESKLSLASDAAAGTASRRTLGTSATAAAAGNHTHARYDNDLGQAGMYAPQAPWTVIGSQILTASRAYFLRFRPSRDMTITNLGFFVGTAASADDACDVGIYSYSGSTLTRLGSAGATTGKLNSTGAKTLATTGSMALTAGTVYYAAFSVGTFGGTGATLLMASWISNGGADLFGAAVGTSELLIKASSHPLGSSVTSLTTGSAAGPQLVVRES